jgi:hypothetical protein
VSAKTRNRTREAGNRDEVEGVVANTLNAFRDGAVGFIDWLGDVNIPFPRAVLRKIRLDGLGLRQERTGHRAHGREKISIHDALD